MAPGTILSVWDIAHVAIVIHNRYNIIGAPFKGRSVFYFNGREAFQLYCPSEAGFDNDTALL